MKKLFIKLQARFTRWYIRRGYTFDYDFTNVPAIGDEYIKYPHGIPKAVWNCPFWVRPMLILFSPSIYSIEAWGKAFIDGLIKGMAEALKL